MELFDEKCYGSLLAKCRPTVIQNDAEKERLTSLLLHFNERGDLSPEELALFRIMSLLVEHYERQYHQIDECSPNGHTAFNHEGRGVKRVTLHELESLSEERWAELKALIERPDDDQMPEQRR